MCSKNRSFMKNRGRNLDKWGEKELIHIIEPFSVGLNRLVRIHFTRNDTLSQFGNVTRIQTFSASANWMFLLAHMAYKLYSDETIQFHFPFAHTSNRFSWILNGLHIWFNAYIHWKCFFECRKSEKNWKKEYRQFLWFESIISDRKNGWKRSEMVWKQCYHTPLSNDMQIYGSFFKFVLEYVIWPFLSLFPEDQL